YPVHDRITGSARGARQKKLVQPAKGLRREYHAAEPLGGSRRFPTATPDRSWNRCVGTCCPTIFDRRPRLESKPRGPTGWRGTIARRAGVSTRGIAIQS